SRRRGARVTSANAGAALESSSKPRWRVYHATDASTSFTMYRTFTVVAAIRELLSQIMPATSDATTHHSTTMSAEARHAASNAKPITAMATSSVSCTALVHTGS